MTMHLLKPHFTTTRYKSRSRKNKTKSQLVAESEHRKFLTKMGVTGSAPKRGKLQAEERESSRDRYHSVSVFEGADAERCLSTKTNTYTGTLIKGISTMHKSNAVPVINDKQAKEIAAMRRN